MSKIRGVLDTATGSFTVDAADIVIDRPRPRPSAGSGRATQSSRMVEVLDFDCVFAHVDGVLVDDALNCGDLVRHNGYITRESFEAFLAQRGIAFDPHRRIRYSTSQLGERVATIVTENADPSRTMQDAAPGAPAVVPINVSFADAQRELRVDFTTLRELLGMKSLQFGTKAGTISRVSLDTALARRATNPSLARV
jgi:hypothetical protein